MRIIQSAFLLLIIFSFSGNLEAQDKKQSETEKDTVRIGYDKNIFTSVNIEDAKAATNFLLDKTIKEWGKEKIKSIGEVFDDVNQVKKEINNNRLDLVVLQTTEYLELKNKVKLTPFMVYRYANAMLSKMLLICRTDCGFNSIKDLRNKKIIISKTFNTNKNLTELWLKTLVLKNNEDFMKNYETNISYYDKPLRCVADVFLRKADALVISEHEYETVKELNPQFGSQLKVLLSSKPLLYSVFCYTEKIKNHPTFTLDELKDKLMSIQNSKTGKQFLTMFRIDSFTPYKDEYIKDTEEFLSEYRKLTEEKKYNSINSNRERNGAKK